MQLILVEPIHPGKRGKLELVDGPEAAYYADLESPELATASHGKHWEPNPVRFNAAVEEGLQLSTDHGATFTVVAGAPVLYSLDARQDGTLIGAGIDGGLWSQATDGTWEQLDSLVGRAQALAAIDANRIALVDDRGVVEVTPDGSTVLSPTG